MKTTTALTTIMIGGLLSFGTSALAQPPESHPAQPGAVQPASPAQPRQGRAPVQPPQAPPPGQPPQAAGPAPQADRPEPNVLLADLAGRVAAETGRTFLIDPRAPARIHLVGPVDATPSYAMLLSILRNSNLMTIEAEGVVHILPDSMARAVPSRIVQTDNESIPDDEIVTRVITLPEGVQAAQLVPVLRPMMPQYAHFAALPVGEGANKVVIVDSYANVKRMTEVIRLLVGSVSF